MGVSALLWHYCIKKQGNQRSAVYKAAYNDFREENVESLIDLFDERYTVSQITGKEYDTDVKKPAEPRKIVDDK